MKWINVKDSIPELHLYDGITTISKCYPVFYSTEYSDEMNVGFLTRTGDKLTWCIGEGYERNVTHWIDTQGPND